MCGLSRIIAVALSALVVAAPFANADGPDDSKAAYEHRVDTMKRMGRALYTTIGKVVRGKAEFSADTVAAAETIVSLSAMIPVLFPPGSAVGDSRAKPEIFAAGARVAELAAGVEAKAGALAAAAKSGDLAALGTAAKALDEACEACHRDFRKPE